MAQKKILHLIATNFYGGPEKQIVEHLVRLNKHPYFKGVLGTFIEGETRNEILERAKSRSVPALGIPMKGPLDVKALYKLINAINDLKIDMICAHHYKSVVMGYMAARYLSIPVLNYSRGFTAENKKVAFYEWLERFFVKRMDGVISVAKGQLEKLKHLGVCHPKSWVVHNGVEIIKANEDEKKPDRSAIEKRWNIPKGSFIAVTAGRLSPEKGHRFLIDAIAGLNSKAPRVYFLILGDGVLMETLRRQAKDLKVADRIRLIGFSSQINQFYQAMDFLVLPSLTEGLPNVVLEAFSFKKPVIATRVGGVPEIIDHGKSGLIVPPEDASALALAIDEIISDKNNLLQMGQMGYEKVLDHFSFDRQNDHLTTIYRTYI